MTEAEEAVHIDEMHCRVAQEASILFAYRPGLHSGGLTVFSSPEGPAPSGNPSYLPLDYACLLTMSFGRSDMLYQHRSGLEPDRNPDILI